MTAKTYRLLGADGRPYQSLAKGLLAGTGARRFTAALIAPPRSAPSGAAELTSNTACSSLTRRAPRPPAFVPAGHACATLTNNGRQSGPVRNHREEPQATKQSRTNGRRLDCFTVDCNDAPYIRPHRCLIRRSLLTGRCRRDGRIGLHQDASLLLPACGEKVGMRGPARALRLAATPPHPVGTKRAMTGANDNASARLAETA